jgi:acyl-CoA synthetase (NDP forming)
MAFRPVDSVLRAKSIALVGASERGRWPTDIYESLREHGYPGKIWLINPRQATVYGERAYPSLRDLPEPADHAVIIVPAAAVPGAVEDAAHRGLKSATVYAGGVGDGEDPVSRALGDQVRATVARSGLRISGPNCMGAFSYREKLFAYPNPSLARLAPGPVACVFQSGGTLQFFMTTGAMRGLRFSYGVSSGNELDLDLADFVNFMVDDEQTKQIVLFIEGIRRPKAFMQAVARALVAGKPIIAIKTGATEKSAHAAASHTGAIAGDYASYLAMCDRYGIINCATLDDLVETTLAFQSGRVPKGPRIGWVTTSGGTVDLLYDCVEQEGSTLAVFTEETNTGIRPFMQGEIKPKNPLDVGIPSTITKAAELCEVVARDPNVDMLAWANQLPPRLDAWPDVEALIKMVAGTDKPLLAFARMAYHMGPEAVAMQDKVGFPFLQGLPATCRALNALWFHAQRSGKMPAVAQARPSDLTADTLDATLARYGIHGPKSRVVRDAACAVLAAQEIGFPVALKIQSRDILHKTEAGGVALNLRSAAAVAAAAEKLTASAWQAYPSARIDGFLVQEMVSGYEAIVGAREDALYGPMLLVGSGGVLVELVQDAALKLLPLAEGEASSMLEGLKLKRLISGFRGQPPGDRGALEAAIESLAAFYLDHRDKIADIEINPLMVRPGGVCAVDVRVIWKE